MNKRIILKNKSGFTLIELLVVIAIISVLSSVILASLSTTRSKASIARAASDLRQIVNALALYQSDHSGAYPCFDHNWSDTKEKAWAAQYLNWPTNPWGYQYHWEHNQQSLTYSISINAPGTANAQALDSLLDDGNLAAGKIKGNGTRLEYGGMPQDVTLNHCHI